MIGRRTLVSGKFPYRMTFTEGKMDSHEREAAGAAAGMVEMYGTWTSVRDANGRTVAVGDTVVFRRHDWEPSVTDSGVVTGICVGRGASATLIRMVDPAAPVPVTLLVRLDDESVVSVPLCDLIPF